MFICDEPPEHTINNMLKIKLMLGNNGVNKNHRIYNFEKIFKKIYKNINIHNLNYEYLYNDIFRINGLYWSGYNIARYPYITKNKAIIKFPRILKIEKIDINYKFNYKKKGKNENE